MSKYYFDESAETMGTLLYWKEYMIENNLKELKLFEAKVDHGTGYFICTAFTVSEIGEVGNCGAKFCDLYKPRNGKNGICNNYCFMYEQTDKVKIMIK